MKCGGKSLTLSSRLLTRPENDVIAKVIGKFANFLSGQARCDAASPALKTDCIELYYQPEIDLETGLAVGVEVLVRWRDGDGKILLPVDFLPRIQSTEVLLSLDLYVLERAMRQSVAWSLRGISPVISVNMSAQHFEAIAFAEKVEAILARVPHFDPCKLAIEILESVAIKNKKMAAEIMTRLRKRGIKFYLDDFGTGHSSAAYLKLFPIDAIKVDQIFARDIPHGPDSAQDVAIIEASVSVAKAFGLPVIAEGIETQDAAMAVKRLGCRIGQGYFFAKPLAEEEFAPWYLERCAPAERGNVQ